MPSVRKIAERSLPFIKRCKKFLFRRGFLPDSDFHEAFDRVRNRFDEVFDQRQLPPLPPARTILMVDESEEAKAAREKAIAKWRQASFERFAKIFTEEAESQWDRIIDRRVANWFYYPLISGVIGFLIGRLL